MTKSLLESPLHDIHVNEGAKFAEFGGWNMPISYSKGTLHEHKSCRSNCAIFDVSHLGTLKVTGKDSFHAIQGTFTNDLNRISPGRAQYSHLLNDSGCVIDDVIIWWIGDSLFEIMPNASNTERVSSALKLFEGDFASSDVTYDRAVIAIQGPESREVLKKVSPKLASIYRFNVRQVEYEDHTLTAAGTGYTGEDGIEVSVPLAVAHNFWRDLVGSGGSPAGLGARDTLRLEAGLPLHGNELSPEINPLEANMKWVIAIEKDDFFGKNAITKLLKDGPSRKLVGIKTQGRRPPRAGQSVTKNGVHVGEVTSGNYSPMLGCGIAIAMVSEKTNLGEKVSIVGRRQEEEGTIVKLPFYAADQSL